MGRRETVEYLHTCATAELFSHEHACIALRRPPPGLDPTLLQKLYARLLTRASTVPDLLRRLAEEHVPIVEGLLEEPKGAESIFAAAFVRHASKPGPTLREAGTLLHKLRMFEWRPGVRKPGRTVIAGFAADPRAVRGSQEVVASCGFDHARHIAVLAADGSDESVDILLPLVTVAVGARDQRLETLIEWLTPFARGRAEELAREIERADPARAIKSRPSRGRAGTTPRASSRRRAMRQ